MKTQVLSGGATQVVADEPISKVASAPGEYAPCLADGEVHEVDDDTKDAICNCSLFTCWVDFSNRVTNRATRTALSLMEVD